jgi:hypothetical protein
VISEFLASNRQGLKDEDGEFQDWIELRNTGSTTVSLQGWFLTDSSAQLAKWKVPATNLPPQQRLMVFASGKDRSMVGARLHTSFSLSTEGEYLALVGPDGRNIVHEFAPKYPPQFDDVSYGLEESSLAPRYFPEPTPGQANGQGYLDYVADTKFSHRRGFYDQAFDLVITVATTNALIRYTTDGTRPSLTNGLVYTTPIRIAATTVLRAAAFKSGWLPSNVDTQTYLFVEDIIGQAANGQPPPGWPASWGANTRDYGMDPDVVNSPAYRDTIKDDLRTVPSFSIVMNLADLFDRTTGIYANPGQDGRDWERPCSVELIHPGGQSGFQIDAGIRIRGGFSRSTSNPKHAFRLFFRSEYGAAKLRYPVFGEGGADSFDAFDLRTFQNYSWSFQGDSRGIFLRDQFSRDTQLDMGHLAERGDFYHLYINGQYWGLFNTCERPEASYGATYLGGQKENFDVIKVEAGPYTILATDGNLQAWTRLYNAARAGLGSDEAYQRVQGNNPDGTPNPAYEKLVDLDNLIDYMLVIFYGGNLDAPISNFLGNTSPNNWYGLRDRTARGGFLFFAHDAEHTLLSETENRTGPYPAGSTSVLKSSPQYVFQQLSANAEFRLRVADRVHQHFFNGGALTPESARARLWRRKTEIDRAVVGESARWGDAKRATPFTRDVDWIREINRVYTNYMSRRSDVVLGQLRAKSLYPTTVAPTFSQHGGPVPAGYSLTLSAPGGAIYFTLGGGDPRLPDGAVAGDARVYQGPVILNESVQIKARVQQGANWSALNQAAFILAQTFTELRITEIMYHPAEDAGEESEELEFLELKSLANRELDVSGVYLTNGVRYVFPHGTRLAPGQAVVLVRNPEAFGRTYPGVAIDGVYSGRLANEGERLTLVHAAGNVITTVAYQDRSPWAETADGAGFSLVPVRLDLALDPQLPASWRASARIGGSPGEDDPVLDLPTVWVNEVLTHTDPPAVDAIELYNPGELPADIGGWYLTDDARVPGKFRIPAGTRVAPRGFQVFTEADFDAASSSGQAFTLSSHGEEVYLFSANAAGELTGFRDGFAFGAAANGVSFGRHRASDGRIYYPAQFANTLGNPNAGPRLGPVIFNEVHYYAPPGEVEFVELKNLTGEPVLLFDPVTPTNRWRIEGIGFEFPPNSQLAPHGLMVVAAGDPSAFRSRYGVPASVPVLGPYAGNLQDNGESLRLLRPDAPDVGADGAVVVPRISVDEVRYRAQSPWPTNAAGLGASLERLSPVGFGSDPVSWRASFALPSPGLENDANRRPRVDAGPDLALQADVLPIATTVSATAVDDGQPTPPGRLTVEWSQLSGPAPVAFSATNVLSPLLTLFTPGVYVLQLRASDGELSGEDTVQVVVERVPVLRALVAKGSVWKYLDTGADLGTAWSAPEYSDAAWKSGPAQLGYGDGDEATVVSFGPNAQSKFTTTYFRRSFEVAGARTIKEASLALLRDDGAIVYLNGTEVFRSNMPEGPVTAATFASAVVSGDDETVNFYLHGVDPALFREGANVLAVEVHQNVANSTDLSFDLELTAQFAPANEPPMADAGPDQTVVLPASARLAGVVRDDGLPSPPGLITLSWTVVSGAGGVTFQPPGTADPQVTFAEPGVYVLRLTASDGELIASDEVGVTVEDSLASWKARYFTLAELGDPAISGDNADPDLDGHNNEEEFLANTDPRDATSVLRFLDAAFVAPSHRLALQFEARPQRVYTVQFRDAADAGDWLALTNVPAATTAAKVEVIDPDSGSQANRYYRVIIPATK